MCLWIDLMNSPQQNRSVRIDCLAKSRSVETSIVFTVEFVHRFALVWLISFQKKESWVSFAMTLHVQGLQYMLLVFDVFRVEAFGQDQAARRTTMSKAPRSQPCLATAAPMAKTPGFHRFDVSNPSPNLQSFLTAKHPSVAEGCRNLTEKHARQRETCGTDLHPQHQQQSMSLLRRQNCPQSAWMHQRCHTWGQLFCWTKCLKWAPWLVFLKEASLTSDFYKEFWAAIFADTRYPPSYCSFP